MTAGGGLSGAKCRVIDLHLRIGIMVLLNDENVPCSPPLKRARLNACKVVGCREKDLRAIAWQRRTGDEPLEFAYACRKCPIAGGRISDLLLNGEPVWPSADRESKLLSRLSESRKTRMVAALDASVGLSMVEVTPSLNTRLSNAARPSNMLFEVSALARVAFMLQKECLSTEEARTVSSHLLTHCCRPLTNSPLPHRLLGEGCRKI
jgi:hypothetical protein